jgi:hypothetical protein
MKELEDIFKISKIEWLVTIILFIILMFMIIFIRSVNYRGGV